MQGLKIISQAEILILSELVFYMSRECETFCSHSSVIKNSSLLLLHACVDGQVFTNILWSLMIQHHIQEDLTLHVRRSSVKVQMYCTAF